MSLSDTLRSLKYQTPKGKVDIPYAYVFDARALVDGNSYLAQQSPLIAAGTTVNGGLSVYVDSDSDFILRTISGMSLCSNYFRMYYSTRTQMMYNLVRSVANWPVLPEAFFPRGSQMLFDLGGVSRAYNVSGGEPHVYTSFLAFQGVRRYEASRFPVYRTPYDYREIPRHYRIIVQPGSAWTDATNGIPTYPRTFTVNMLEGDFELLSVSVIDLQTFAPPTLNPFWMRMYDALGWYRFSDPGFNCFFFSALAPRVVAVPAVNNWYAPQYPTPSSVYPEAGGIKFELQSLLPFADVGNVYEIDFYGIHRQRNATHFSIGAAV